MDSSIQPVRVSIAAPQRPPSCSLANVMLWAGPRAQRRLECGPAALAVGLCHIVYVRGSSGGWLSWHPGNSPCLWNPPVVRECGVLQRRHRASLCSE